MKEKKIVTLHHSAISRKDLYEQFDAIKKGHIARGFGDIGYHHFIEPVGKRKKGRPEYMDGAHCYGHNRNNIGICLGGNFSIEYPTREQEIELCKLLVELDDRYIIEIKHHRDFKATQCPGNLLSKEWHKDLISNNKKMKYVIDEKNEQYLLDDELKIALSIGDEIELKELQKRGLKGQPSNVNNIKEYEIYPLVRKSRWSRLIKTLKDLSGF